MDWTLYLLIGAAAGLAAGYLGIGGGLIIVPALAAVLAHRFPNTAYAMNMAVATSLATIIVTSFSAIASHWRLGVIDWSTVRRLAPAMAIGALAGGWLADRLGGRWLTLVFALYALIAGLRLLRNVGTAPMAGGTTRYGLFGLLTGAASSLGGIGGGSMTVPLLSRHGVAIQRAIAVSAVCGYPIAVAGMLSHILAGLGRALPTATSGYVYWPAFIGIAVASVITAPLGAILVHRSDPALVKRLFGLFLLAVAAYLFWSTV